MIHHRKLEASRVYFPASHTTEQCLLHGNLLDFPQNTFPIMLEATGLSLLLFLVAHWGESNACCCCAMVWCHTESWQAQDPRQHLPRIISCNDIMLQTADVHNQRKSFKLGFSYLLLRSKYHRVKPWTHEVVFKFQRANALFNCQLPKELANWVQRPLKWDKRQVVHQSPRKNLCFWRGVALKLQCFSFACKTWTCRLDVQHDSQIEIKHLEERSSLASPRKNLFRTQEVHLPPVTCHSLMCCQPTRSNHQRSKWLVFGGSGKQTQSFRDWVAPENEVHLKN